MLNTVTYEERNISPLVIGYPQGGVGRYSTFPQLNGRQPSPRGHRYTPTFQSTANHKFLIHYSKNSHQSFTETLLLACLNKSRVVSVDSEDVTAAGRAERTGQQGRQKLGLGCD